jgi:hypothetical protein
MSSFEKVRPGMRPRFLSQKMAAKDPEKNIPSTQAKARILVAKLAFWFSIHLIVQSAFLVMQGTRVNMINGTSLNSLEQKGTFLGVFDVGIDEDRVHFGVDVFNHDLEAIEASCLVNLDVLRESFDQVLVNDTIGSSEKGQDTGDEEAFVVVEFVFPVIDIL